MVDEPECLRAGIDGLVPKQEGPAEADHRLRVRDGAVLRFLRFAKDGILVQE